MTDDIVERLLVPVVPPCICNAVVRRECKSCVDRIDALHEIERLREANVLLRDVIVNWPPEAEMQEAERLRLQAVIDAYAEAERVRFAVGTGPGEFEAWLEFRSTCDALLAAAFAALLDNATPKEADRGGV